MTHVDAHHHLWNPLRGDYGWMPANDRTLSRTYGPADLTEALAHTDVSQTVLVQAAATLNETEYLLGLADACPTVAKVVGWINFEDERELGTLKRLANHPKFAGVRPMIQDLSDDNWMLSADIQWAFRALIDLDLTFDCLGFCRHLANFHTLLTRYPDLRAVIDHCMKPQIRDGSEAHFQMWSDGLKRIAEDTLARCKLSGLATEADVDWSTETLKPYADHVINVFGAERVMWGSDWPVVRLRMEYGDWYHMCQKLTASLSDTDRTKIFSATARRFYRIKP
ncbi:MAG: amidohydrolase family protein [Pseudomonadota bacterium]